MTKLNNPQPPLTLDPQVDEERVRRALGLNTTGTHGRLEGGRQRHRFVTDGAVPVVVLNRAERESSGLKERLEAAEAALEAERAAHAATKRALQDAQATHQAVQTRLGHAELAHGEAIAAERAARHAAEEALATLRTELMERPAVAKSPEPEPIARKVRVVHPTQVEKEQKPVRWWTPSYRAKRKR